MMALRLGRCVRPSIASRSNEAEDSGANGTFAICESSDPTSEQRCDSPAPTDLMIPASCS
jgi:hypothetical protein